MDNMNNKYDRSFVIKIKERFFGKYQNKRVMTAWSLAGAVFFLDDDSAKFQRSWNC